LTDAFLVFDDESLISIENDPKKPFVPIYLSDHWGKTKRSGLREARSLSPVQDS
jgi:hypothetical protein